WLEQHVPHRICAALAGLAMPEDWAAPRPPNLPNENFRVWCADRSVDEGRKAAMRWLIEFVGVQPDRFNEPKATEPYGNGKSVTIVQVGGTMFDPTTKSEDARTLAKISRACAQASGHPTADKNHARLEDPDIASALL